jgi:DNA-binding PadR family transcriptional regulator
MPPDKPEILPGTLDLMVLKTLAVFGPLHGYGLARRIEKAADGAACNTPSIFWFWYRPSPARFRPLARCRSIQ